MNVPIQPVVPSASAEPPVASRRARLNDDQTWDFEELVGAEFQPRPVGRPGWRLWLTLVLALGLGAAGGLGRLLSVPGPAVVGSAANPSETTAGSGPLAITSPALDAEVDGAVVRVQGVTTEDAGVVRFAVVMGGAVLGWTTAELDRPGPVDVAVPIFAPAVSVEVDLLVVPVDAHAAAPTSVRQMAAAATLRRAFRLRPGGPVGLWPPQLVGSGTGRAVEVSGYAPVGVRRLTVRLMGRSGRVIAQADVAPTRDGSRPGAAGGYSLGLGSFVARLPVGETRDRPVRVEVDWSDDIGGEWGTSVTAVPATVSDVPGT